MNATKVSAIWDDSDVARLREDFEYYDRDHDGLMEYDEFVRFLGALDGGTSGDECRIGFREIDDDLDGVIEFDEFLEWWGSP